jgi:hypothetical protein
MFPACTVAGGQAMGTPDVCLTPAPPAPPVPVPYPNIAMMNLATGFVPTVLVGGMPALNMQSMISISSGDEAGVNGGVASGTFIGPAKFLKGSAKVQIGGQPSVRMTDSTGQNGSTPNAVGTVMAPSQTKVLVGG